MAILLKNLQKFLSNLRLNNLSGNNHKHKLLLKRCDSVDTPYLSILSPQDFSSTKHIRLLHFDEFRIVVGSCNGLVCLDNTLDKFLVCNPSTGESNIISSRRFREPSPSTLKKHSFSSGFGYDSNSKHFKLVRFIYYFAQHILAEDEDRYRLATQIIELYDVNSDSWRYIDHPEPGNFVLRNPSVYVNGHNINYWLAYFKDTPYILSFNFASEEFSALHLPDLGKNLSLKGSSLHFDLLEFKGGISVVVHPKFGTEKSFGIWIRNGDSWIKEYEFCVPGAQRPLGFGDNDRLLLFEGTNGQVIAYDIDTRKTTMRLDIYDSSGKMQLFPYVQSDVSVKGILGTAKTSPVNMERMSMLSSNSDSIISSLTQKISSITRWRG